MIKKIKLRVLIFFLIIVIICIYFFLSSLIGNDKLKNLKLLLSDDQRHLIEKYIFPYKLISTTR